MCLYDFKGVTVCHFLCLFVGACVLVSVCLSAWICVYVLLALGLTWDLHLTVSQLGLLCTYVSLQPCLSLSCCLWLFLSLSVVKRAPAGDRDKSPEEVGLG